MAVVVSRREFDRLRATRRHFGEAYRRFLERCSLDTCRLERDVTGPRDTSAGRKVSL